MKNTDSFRKAVERALAFAYAALDDPSAYRILEAKGHAENVLPHLGRMNARAFTLGEGKQLVELVGHLRAILEVLDQRLHPHARIAAS